MRAQKKCLYVDSLFWKWSQRAWVMDWGKSEDGKSNLRMHYWLDHPCRLLGFHPAKTFWKRFRIYSRMVCSRQWDWWENTSSVNYWLWVSPQGAKSLLLPNCTCMSPGSFPKVPWDASVPGLEVRDMWATKVNYANWLAVIMPKVKSGPEEHKMGHKRYLVNGSVLRWIILTFCATVRCQDYFTQVCYFLRGNIRSMTCGCR